jgi:hypothetical protein
VSALLSRVRSSSGAHDDDAGARVQQGSADSGGGIERRAASDASGRECDVQETEDGGRVIRCSSSSFASAP